MRRYLFPFILFAILAYFSGLYACSVVRQVGTTIQKDAQVTLTQAKAGLEYLQATYTRLQAAGAIPGLDDLAKGITELNAVITKGDLTAAVALYNDLRTEVGKLAAVAGATGK